ncbi:MAG: hypothetical protein ABJD68_13555 [Nakamurella sp.]
MIHIIGQVVIVAIILGVVVLLYYLWKHREGPAARGLGAAGAEYNVLYGQGAPPEIPPPAAHGKDTRTTGDAGTSEYH